MGFSAHSLSPVEQGALLAAERDGDAFLAYRDGHGDLRLVPIEDLTRVTIGRASENDVVLEADPQVSRAHAVLERSGGGWALLDNGMSRNGSFVNGERVQRQQRLADDDMVRIGNTSILFCCPTPPIADSTIAASGASAARISEAERRVLVALCRGTTLPSRVTARTGHSKRGRGDGGGNGHRAERSEHLKTFLVEGADSLRRLIDHRSTISTLVRDMSADGLRRHGPTRSSELTGPADHL